MKEELWPIKASPPSGYVPSMVPPMMPSMVPIDQIMSSGLRYQCNAYSLGSLLYVWVCLRLCRCYFSGYQLSSPNASPKISLNSLFKCLNCIRSSVASRNLKAFAANADVSRSLIRSVFRLSAFVYISFLILLNPRHSSSVCWTVCLLWPKGQSSEKVALILYK